MKIFILNPSDTVRPSRGFIAPAHNEDFGIEQDFWFWLHRHPEYLTDDPAQADFDYLPIFWNRFYCNHWGDHTDILQAEILRCVSRNRPTFTIAEYDIPTMQPFLDLCGMTVFCGSRHGANGCIDIPLLCSPHQLPPPQPTRWRASFMGKFETSGYREQMRLALFGRTDVYLSEGKGTGPYAELMAASLVALAPRGYGGQSFRFYEAMQFGAVPFLIGDIDTRPFREWINWDGCSLYTDDASQISRMLDSYDDGLLRHMGQVARQLWEEEIHYGRWCKYVLRELDRR